MPGGAAVSAYSVVLTATLTGSIDDFDGAARDAIVAAVASKAAVPLSAVTVHFTAASVLLTVTIASSGAAHGATIISALSPSLGSVTAASAFLGVPLASTATLTPQESTTLVAASPSPPPAPLSPAQPPWPLSPLLPASSSSASSASSSSALANGANDPQSSAAVVIGLVVGIVALICSVGACLTQVRPPE